jgi:hypothetical protein
MRCSESQTTCIAPDAQPRAASVFQALLFTQVLEPLTKPLGPVGEITLDSVAQQLFIPKPR